MSVAESGRSDIGNGEIDDDGSLWGRGLSISAPDGTTLQCAGFEFLKGIPRYDFSPKYSITQEVISDALAGVATAHKILSGLFPLSNFAG